MRIIQLTVPEPLFIGILYNPDSSGPYWVPVNDLREMFAFLRKNCKPNLKLVGDFNIQETNWDTYHTADNNDQLVPSFIEDCGLIQMVNFKTTKSSCFEPRICNRGSIYRCHCGRGRHGRLFKSYPTNNCFNYK